MFRGLEAHNGGWPMSSVTIGLDLGDRYSGYCVLDSEARILEEGRVRTTPEALGGWFAR